MNPDSRVARLEKILGTGYGPDEAVEAAWGQMPIIHGVLKHNAQVMRELRFIILEQHLRSGRFNIYEIMPVIYALLRDRFPVLFERVRKAITRARKKEEVNCATDRS